MAGLNSANTVANPADEKAWQIQQKLIKIARDVEYSFINGKYALATAANEANKTRGLMELCASDAGTSIDAASAKLSKTLLDQLFIHGMMIHSWRQSAWRNRRLKHRKHITRLSRWLMKISRRMKTNN